MFDVDLRRKIKVDRLMFFLIVVVAALTMSACAPAAKNSLAKLTQVTKTAPQQLKLSGKSYTVRGQRYHILSDAYGYQETGIASWYGPRFHGRRTANGEKFDMTKLTAAHKTLPLGSLVRVTNLKNGQAVVVRINDRGPFSKGRVIDLSKAAAREIGIYGIAQVDVEVLGGTTPVLDFWEAFKGHMKYIASS